MNIKPAKKGPSYACQRSPDYLADLTFHPNRSAYYQSNTEYYSDFTYIWRSFRGSKYQYAVFVDRIEVNPGETVIAKMWLMSPAPLYGKLEIGQEFEIILAKETEVGTGCVLKIYDSRLEVQQSP